ncbi:MAG: LysR substrate-binding domain-containing protein [Kiloniellales bacterium]
MSYRLPPLNAFRVFEAVARHESFTKAADELFLSQGAVSYQIKSLEEKLGMTLLLRSARAVTLTPEGTRLLPVVCSALRRLQEEIAAIKAEQEGGVLTIALSTYTATRWLSPRINSFLRTAPGTRIQIHHSLEDPLPGPGGADLAIRWGRGRWSGLEARLLIPSPMLPYCSPELAAELSQPADIARATLLREDPPFDLWEAWVEHAGLDAATIGQSLVISDSNVRVQAAVDHQGLVLADVLAAPEIESGRLVAPFGIALEGWGYYLLYEAALAEKPAVAAFLDWAANEKIAKGLQFR